MNLWYNFKLKQAFPFGAGQSLKALEDPEESVSVAEAGFIAAQKLI